MKITVNKDVAGAVAEAKSRINAAAEEARKRETSSGEVMQTVYAHKHAEAVKFLSGEQTGYYYPLLSAEAEALQLDKRTVALRIVNRVEEWKVRMGEIEAQRLALLGRICGLNCVVTIREMAQSASFD